MGLRCLFGHEFGGREVERDRREDGDEVVVAYRTVETCERCGSRRVVSENKEIKPLDSSRTRSDSGSGTESTTLEEPRPADPSEPTPTTEPAATDEPVEVPAAADAAEPTADDAEVLSESGDDTAPTPEETATPAPNAGDTVADASDDAAIILDDAADVASAASAGSEESAPDPEPTEPTDETDETDGDAWPDQTGEDQGVDATTPTAGGASVSTDDHGRSHDPWPGAGTDETDGVERDRNGTRFVRAESRDERGGTAEFRCPNCESARPASSSSLRPGDVCPDCRKGYLAEVTVED